MDKPVQEVTKKTESKIVEELPKYLSVFGALVVCASFYYYFTRSEDTTKTSSSSSENTQSKFKSASEVDVSSSSSGSSIVEEEFDPSSHPKIDSTIPVNGLILHKFFFCFFLVFLVSLKEYDAHF